MSETAEQFSHEHPDGISSRRIALLVAVILLVANIFDYIVVTRLQQHKAVNIAGYLIALLVAFPLVRGRRSSSGNVITSSSYFRLIAIVLVVNAGFYLLMMAGATLFLEI